MPQPTKIVVHWLEDSRAQRILWLLEELGMDYEVKQYKRNTETLLAPPELKEVHPLGKSPVIVVTEGTQTVTVAESASIVEFLIERYGKGELAVPASSEDLQARADYLYWKDAAEGSFMLPMMLSIVFSQLPRKSPWYISAIVGTISSGAMSSFIIPRLKKQFGFIEDSLKGKDFLVANKLTGADIMMSFLAEGLKNGPLDNADYPEIFRWYNGLTSREAYKKAEEKGGKVDLSRFRR